MNVEFIPELNNEQFKIASELLISRIETGTLTRLPGAINKPLRLSQLELVRDLCHVLALEFDREIAQLRGELSSSIVDNRLEIERIERLNRQRYLGIDSATIARKNQAAETARQAEEAAARRKAEIEGMQANQLETIRQMGMQIR